MMWIVAIILHLLAAICYSTSGNVEPNKPHDKLMRRIGLGLGITFTIMAVAVLA